MARAFYSTALRLTVKFEDLEKPTKALPSLWKNLTNITAYLF